MGLFKKREKPPADVGTAIACVDSSGRGYIAQQHHQKLTPDAIAALAPVTFVINMAMGFASRSNKDAKKWLKRVTSYDGPRALTAKVNPNGVVPLGSGDPETTFEAAVVGSFHLLPTSELVGTWSPKGPFDPDKDAMPLLGVLLAGAAMKGVDDDVWHAIDGLAAADVDFRNPEVLLRLPQRLLDYGAEQSALDSMRDPRKWAPHLFVGDEDDDGDEVAEDDDEDEVAEEFFVGVEGAEYDDGVDDAAVASAMWDTAFKVEQVRPWMSPVVKYDDVSDRSMLWVRMSPFTGALVLVGGANWFLSHRVIDEDGDPGDAVKEGDDQVEELLPFGCEIDKLVHALVTTAAMTIHGLLQAQADSKNIDLPDETLAWIEQEMQSFIDDGWVEVEE